MGFPNLANRRIQEALKLAERVDHPMTIAYTVSRACWLPALKGDLEDVTRYAAALDAVAREFRFENFKFGARFFTHWHAVQGVAADAERIAHIHQAIDGYRATGTVVSSTGFLAFFAEACATAGDIGAGLAAVDESLALAEQKGELWFQAEALRVKGELLRLQAAEQAQPKEALSAAEACFERAREVAKQQGALSFELRAAVSLCELWQGERGLETLGGIVARFGEGAHSMDMQRAKTLLGEA